MFAAALPRAERTLEHFSAGRGYCSCCELAPPSLTRGAAQALRASRRTSVLHCTRGSIPSAVRVRRVRRVRGLSLLRALLSAASASLATAVFLRALLARRGPVRAAPAAPSARHLAFDTPRRQQPSSHETSSHTASSYDASRLDTSRLDAPNHWSFGVRIQSFEIHGFGLSAATPSRIRLPASAPSSACLRTIASGSSSDRRCGFRWSCWQAAESSAHMAAGPPSSRRNGPSGLPACGL